MIPARETERILAEQPAELGGGITGGWGLAELTVRGDGADAVRSATDGTRTELSARHIVAAAVRPTQVREVVWSSRFRVHHRLAATYQAGPACCPRSPHCPHSAERWRSTSPAFETVYPTKRHENLDHPGA